VLLFTTVGLILSWLKNLSNNATATKPIPTTAPLVDGFNIIDDINLVPHDGMPLLAGPPDHQIVLGLSFFNEKGVGGEQYR
jgi:hypothetical protein